MAQFMINQSAPPAKIRKSAHTTESLIHWLTLSRAKQSIASTRTKKTPDASPSAEPVARTGGGATTKPTQATSHTSTNADTKKARGTGKELMGLRQGWALCAYPRG